MPIPKRLLSADISAKLLVLPYDVVVIGAGVAGLAFTLRLAPNKRVALLTKGHLGESNTRYAQGGLSAAIGTDDSPELHERDTLAAGAGLCEPEMVHRLVEGAPEAVEWLLSVGTNFDRDSSNGQLLLGREAAHSRRRVLHAGGDATGAEIERALVAAVHSSAAVDIFETAFALDLVIEDDKITGLTADLGIETGLAQFSAPTVVIAAGGAGQLWAITSNPSGATADGVAMAFRSGVAVADLEFVQFHPTVLTTPGNAPFLISEAVRGEGAYLRGAEGERFMVDAHPLAELAPRDVVAREIQRQITADKSTHVYLDLRHLDSPAMESRFPTIARELAARGLNLSRDLIPIAPAAHYFMGGIVAGANGETSLPGLLAIGEAACTGVHGANRLASNSLLEGLVFGLEAADMLNRQTALPRTSSRAKTNQSTVKSHENVDPSIASRRARLQQTMSQHVAVVREGSGLRDAAAEMVEFLDFADNDKVDASREVWEFVNMATAASAIIHAAFRRAESRGAHFRGDYPETIPTYDGLHFIVGGDEIRWRLEELSSARARLAVGV